MSLPALLVADSIKKRFGEIEALSSFSIQLMAGERLVLLGENGAGKSTALRCLAGLLRPSEGKVFFNGMDTTHQPDLIRRMIGLMPEVPGLYERMTAREYLLYFSRLYGMEESLARNRIEEMLERFHLSSVATRWIASYSKGMRQKVALIRATMHHPQLILADEPTSALDPAAARVAWAYLNDLVASGSGLIVCTHSMDEAKNLSDRIGVMARGQLLASGNWHELTITAGFTPSTRLAAWPDLSDIYLALISKASPDREGG